MEDVGHLPLFAGLTPGEAGQFLGLAQRIVVPVGEALIRAGEPADSFYLILRGTVEVRVRRGEVAQPVAHLQAGQLVGEMAFFQATPFRLADVYVVREALLAKFPFQKVHEACAANPALGEKIRRNLRFVTVDRARENVARAAHAAPHLQPLTPMQRRTAIARCAAFQDFTAEALTGVVEVSEPRRYQAMEVVIHAGEPADSLYVVALGHLEVRVATDLGIFSIAQLGPGQCVGELALVYHSPTRTASVIASQPSTLLRIRYDKLLAALREIPGAQERLLANLGSLAGERAGELARIEEAARDQPPRAP